MYIICVCLYEVSWLELYHIVGNIYSCIIIILLLFLLIQYYLLLFIDKEELTSLSLQRWSHQSNKRPSGTDYWSWEILPSFKTGYPLNAWGIVIISLFKIWIDYYFVGDNNWGRNWIWKNHSDSAILAWSGMYPVLNL